MVIWVDNIIVPYQAMTVIILVDGGTDPALILPLIINILTDTLYGLMERYINFSLWN